MNESLPSLPGHDIIGKQTLEIISRATHFNKWMFSAIQPFIKGEVLEIGAGIGNISDFIIRNGYMVTLSDYNDEYGDLLTKRFFEEPNVKGVLQIDLLLPDFENHFFSLKEKFDTIILLNVIEHLENDALATANCNFLLKKGGHLIVLAPAYRWLYCNLDKQLGHYRRYSGKKLGLVLRNSNFKIISNKSFNVLGITGWIIFGKIFRKKMIGKEMNSFERLVPVAKAMDKIVFQKIGLSVITVGSKE